MGTIVPRGESIRAVVRIKGHPTETKTFAKNERMLAKAWINETEVAIRKKEKGSRGVSVSSLITKFLEEVAPKKKISADSTRAFHHLERTTKTLFLSDLSLKTVLDWKEKNHPDAGPASTARYLTRIGTVLSTAEAMWDTPIPWKEWRKLIFNMKNFGVVGLANQRTRRLKSGELDLIKANVSSQLPVVDIIDFALDSCMRSAEITRIKWEDLDREKRTIIIRSRKHPTKKESNDQEVPLLGATMTIIERQPNVADEIFPYDSDSVEAAFRRARKKAGIEDLTFHDLRHEGISRLFEAGYNIQEVAIVSGHSSWNSLKIYTNLKPESLHRE